jgi:DNA mismatch endonuclease (patch repair protein)
VAGGSSRLEQRVRGSIPPSFGKFETNQADLKGTPDIVFRDSRVVVFVHGCYWHRHEGCARAIHPKADPQRWMRVFNTTVRRDQEALVELRDQGWKCLVFWECQILDQLDDLVGELGRTLGVTD